MFCRLTFHAKSPKPIFGDFKGLPPDSPRLSIDFDRLSVIFNQLQSIPISFNQFDSIGSSQNCGFGLRAFEMGGSGSSGGNRFCTCDRPPPPPPQGLPRPSGPEHRKSPRVESGKSTPGRAPKVPKECAPESQKSPKRVRKSPKTCT